MCNSTTLNKESCESYIIIDIICISSVFILFVGILLNISQSRRSVGGLRGWSPTLNA